MAPGAQQQPSSVLFVCSMNAVRSPMAEALMKYLFPGRIYVQSAGVRPGETDPLTTAVMDEVGLDLSRHRPRSFDEIDDASFDLIITLAPEAHHWALELTRTMAADVEYWPTLDPSLVEGNREQQLDAYRAIRDQLMQKIKRRFDWRGGPSV